MERGVALVPGNKRSILLRLLSIRLRSASSATSISQSSSIPTSDRQTTKQTNMATPTIHQGKCTPNQIAPSGAQNHEYPRKFPKTNSKRLRVRQALRSAHSETTFLKQHLCLQDDLLDKPSILGRFGEPLN